MPTTPSERRLQAQIAADTRWAMTDDRTAATEAARAAALLRFETKVDPEGKLPPAERHQRALRLQRAWMRSLNLKSVKAKRARAEAKKAEAEQADGETARAEAQARAAADKAEGGFEAELAAAAVE